MSKPFKVVITDFITGDLSPELTALGDIATITALDAFSELSRIEGIIPALETSHALAYVKKAAPTMRPDQHLLINLSGRGDKDIGTVADLSNADFYCRPSCQGQSVKGGEQPVNFVK